MIDDDGVNAKVGAPYGRQPVEEAGAAVYRLEVRDVVLHDPYRVECPLVCRIGHIEDEGVYGMLVADGQVEFGDVHHAVEQRVASVGAWCPYVERVGERGRLVAVVDVVDGVDGVLYRAVDGGAGVQERESEQKIYAMPGHP